MPATQEYEYLLECENVIGVDYDESENRVTVFVSQKRPKDCLDDEDDVEKRVVEAGHDADVDVVDAGYDETKEGFDALSVLEPMPEAAPGRQDRHRPVPGGVSEINVDSTAGTGGPYPARVEDASAAAWSDDVDEGDLVRLSNNHVYARSNAADFGEPILQPSPEDGGDEGDAVGELVGYVPIEDEALVDVAARSVDRGQESATYYELEADWPTGVRREEYADPRGETVTKTGRTTGVTSADVEATSASVRVEFGEQGAILFRDQLVTGYMSEPGDSGSPVFLENGELVGLLFAGSSRQTICNRIANVEAELGVEILVTEPDEEDENNEKGEDEEVPVYTTTMDHTVTVDLEAQSPELEALEFDGELQPGTTVDVTATLSGEPGEYWLAVEDERTTVSIDEDGDGEGTLSVWIPDDASPSTTLRIRGGPIETLE
ncbi:trypsin-like serine protease [Natronobacterium texcoconense]|uniref:Peptidase S1 domain-containing protein n=1 Tax=Natronobacterium texcoconense TaxID=1095778 RepID=A0A1H1BS70_NATTX|nr:hypothetical protein [Natronobacterium texcoconense]SDQ54775.1 hypothetical protein SAMN04489842_1134 [Natronobacterium texcoconense]